MPAPVFTLAAGVQNYEWGVLGKSSKVAQYAVAASSADFELDESKSYAELWMGTHPTLPSKVKLDQKLLSDYLRENPHFIGEKVTQKFGKVDGSLPFLFKIMAIRKALSIQAHPDKQLAERLHRERPDLYKDDNHKPEMAIAITDFKALCGFRPLKEISIFLRDTSELAALIPPTIIAKFSTIVTSPTPNGPSEKAVLRDLWSALMTADPAKVHEESIKLVTRYKAGGLKNEERLISALVATIGSQFPGDVGIFCVFLLNVVDLHPGEAIFLGAGEPHAYISGDIVETMATSDNVLRAGLTPKPRDVANLVSSLTYESGPASNHFVSFSEFAPNSSLYDPPVPEFSVIRTTLNYAGEETHRAIDGPSIAIVTAGSGSIRWKEDEIALLEGSVFFIGAESEITLRSGEGGLQVYRAFVETG